MRNIFTSVTVKTLKENRTRTLVTIIGILLATSMLTAVTTFVSSIQQFMLDSAIATEGNWHGAVFGISEEKKEEIAKDPKVAACASYQEVGYARLYEAEPGGAKQYLFVAGFEDSLFEMLPLRVKTGRLPENAKELVVSSQYLTAEQAGIQLGDTLTLDLGKRFCGDEELGYAVPVTWVTDKGEKPTDEEWEEPGKLRPDEELKNLETRTYTVVGIIERSVAETYNSAAYYALTCAEEAPAKDSTFTTYYRMKHPGDIYEFDSRVNSGNGGTTNGNLLRYEGSSTNRPMMQMLYGLTAIVTLLIMTGGIALVYNSFSISVADRTKQFGILASVGATPRQLRGMVRKEALLVSALGIPLGVGAGILGIGVTLYITRNSFVYLNDSGIPMRLHVSVPAVLAAALTALLTVLLSAAVPARRASRVSPMEAIRQTKDVRVGKEAARKGKIFFRLFGLGGLLAGRQFARNKRQYRVTVFSLFISIVLFISASSFSTYLRRSVDIANKAPGYDVSVYIYGEGKEYEEFYKEIGHLPSVDRIYEFRELYLSTLIEREKLEEEYAQNFLELEKKMGRSYGAKDKIPVDVRLLILDGADYLQYLKEQGLDAKTYADLKELKTPFINHIQLYSNAEEKLRNYQILKEENQSLSLSNRNGFTAELSMGKAVEKAPLDLYAGWGGGLCFILSDSMGEQLFKDAGDRPDIPMDHRLYLKARNHQKAADEVETLALTDGTSSSVYVVDMAQDMLDAKNLLLMMDIFSYGFIILISLIAAANVFNTITTGVLLRRKEFAVLASVGMGPSDRKHMLMFECLIYGCKSLCLGLPVALLVTYRIYRVVADGMDVGFYVPFNGILTAIFSVFLVVFVSMRYAVSKLKKENVIDSIRRESV